MKRSIQCSAIALTLFGAIGIFNIAHACSPNLPNYGNCVRQQQEAQQHAMLQQQRNQQGYYYNNSGYGGHTHHYVAVTFDQTGKPFIFRDKYRTEDYVFNDWDWATEMALQACNNQPNIKRPCRFGTAATNSYAIAYITNDKFSMSKSGDKGYKIKKQIKEECKQYYGDIPECKKVKWELGRKTWG